MFNPVWPAPPRVNSVITQTKFTLAQPGFSEPPYARFNLAAHVGDDIQAVANNRHLLSTHLGFGAVQWIEQVHGVDVFKTDTEIVTPAPVADAVYTSTPHLPVAVLTADCLPVLFCSMAGDEIAAAHAGWRGLAQGVLIQTLNAFSTPPSQLLAYLGPAIGSRHFEVGEDVRQVFIDAYANYGESVVLCFQPSQRPEHYLADLYALARLQLRAHGLNAVYGGECCTYADNHFYSFRRASHENADGRCGRMASVIWLSN